MFSQVQMKCHTRGGPWTRQHRGPIDVQFLAFHHHSSSIHLHQAVGTAPVWFLGHLWWRQSGPSWVSRLSNYPIMISKNNHLKDRFTYSISMVGDPSTSSPFSVSCWLAFADCPCLVFPVSFLAFFLVGFGASLLELDFGGMLVLESSRDNQRKGQNKYFVFKFKFIKYII